jgi:hypothetical protein
MSRISPSLKSEEFEILAAAKTLSADDHGKTFFLNLAGGFNVNLPAPEIGLKFRFMVKTAPTTSYTITARDAAGAAANIIKGQVLTVDVNSATDPDFDVTAVDILTFVLNKAVAGDWATLECDGAIWYVVAGSSVFDAITMA